MPIRPPLLPYSKLYFGSSFLCWFAEMGLVFAHLSADDGLLLLLFSLTTLLVVTISQMVTYLVVRDAFENGKNLEGLIPTYSKYLQVLGPLLSVIVTLTLFTIQPLPGTHHILLMVIPLHTLCIVLLFRPIETDMGLFFPWFGPMLSLTVRDYGWGWELIGSLLYSAVLWCFRTRVEALAVIAAREQMRQLRAEAEAPLIAE